MQIEVNDVNYNKKSSNLEDFKSRISCAFKCLFSSQIILINRRKENLTLTFRNLTLSDTSEILLEFGNDIKQIVDNDNFTNSLLK